MYYGWFTYRDCLKSMKICKRKVTNLLLKRRHNEQAGNYSVLIINISYCTLNNAEQQQLKFRLE